MTTASIAPADPPRFHDARPTDLRTARPWHRLAYIVRALPAGIADLAGDVTLPPGGRVLDFGSAESPYRHLFRSDADWVAADLPGNPDADVHVQPDGTVPIADASVDLVLSTQVLEHVTDPATYLAECFRVLRPGGTLLLSTHGLMVFHPDPDDYWRWTCSGLRRAVEQAGFTVQRFEGIMGLLATGLQLVQDAVYYKLPGPLRPPCALVLQSLIAVADRRQSAEARRLNALVFAMLARKS